MTIRELTSTDRDRLLAFYLSLDDDVNWFYRPFGDATPDKLAGHLVQAEAGRAISLGLCEEGDGGGILGHAFISNTDTARPVFGIGLHQRVIGQGWGRRLMEACLAEADRQGLPLVALTVLKTNERAVPLYESLGFVRTGEATFRAGNDSLAMERRPR
jgi:ribosomal protein S18 acetylase RimI-like enzyme